MKFDETRQASQDCQASNEHRTSIEQASQETPKQFLGKLGPFGEMCLYNALPLCLGRVGCLTSAIGPVESITVFRQTTFVQRYEVFFAAPRCTAGVQDTVLVARPCGRKEYLAGAFPLDKGRHNPSECRSRLPELSQLPHRLDET